MMKKNREIDELIPDIKRLTENGIHTTMLSVIETIRRQMRNGQAQNDNTLYWDAINITFTLDLMAEHFLNKLEESYQGYKEAESLIGDEWERVTRYKDDR
jgi:hypothetical protein